MYSKYFQCPFHNDDLLSEYNTPRRDVYIYNFWDVGRGGGGRLDVKFETSKDYMYYQLMCLKKPCF